MSETKPTLVERKSLAIAFAAEIDAAGRLQLRYNGKLLSDYEGRFEVECDADETVAFQFAGFRHGGSLWSVAGDPRLPKADPDAPLAGPWTIDKVVGNMNEAVEVTVTASAQGQASKSQKIYIKTKPRTILPDPQMGS